MLRRRCLPLRSRSVSQGAGLVLMLVLSSCTAPASTREPTEGPSPPVPGPVDGPPTPEPVDGRVTCPAPTATVSTTDELRTALAAAKPGDVIVLADGTYTGNFTATAAGRADRAIFLCGGAGAALDAGGIKEGYVLHLDGAAYWRVVGITVRNGQKGVMLDRTQHSVLQGLTVETTGDEAVHLRRGSSDNVVRDSTVRDTGHRRDKFGEGIYVGTATSNWGQISSGEPDRSDRNLILGNQVSATTAESVDLKEGTSDGVVRGNTFDGSALTGADSWLDAKGNDWQISGNTGAHSPVDGFQNHDVSDGWGRGNVFAGNSGSDLATHDEEGVLIGLHPDRETVVGCDNRVTDGSAPVTNGTCR